jgi:hypothetical protein
MFSKTVSILEDSLILRMQVSFAETSLNGTTVEEPHLLFLSPLLRTACIMT